MLGKKQGRCTVNDIENEYMSLELPNILLEASRGRLISGPLTNTHTSPFIFPLIKRLAEARPKWKFVANVDRRSSKGGGLYLVSHFDVYEGNIKLGMVWKGYTGRGDVICIDNDRMTTDRKRGSCTSTNDVNKAFKVIVKNFRGPSLNELVKEAVGSTTTIVPTLAYQYRSTFNRKFSGMNDFLVSYAMNNWEHMKQEAIDAGINPVSLDGLEEAYVALKATQEINDSLANNKGATVLLRGDEYVVVINGAVSIFDTDHLPSHIKRSIGILKMVENNKYVEGHGVRTAKDKFFVSSTQGAAA